MATILPYETVKGTETSYVWLIWGLNRGQCDLIAIATNEETRDRYLKTGELMGRYHVVKDEKAYVDHLFGGGMLAMINKARARGIE